MSLSVFNGLLYGGDMAPDVKQDGAAVFMTDAAALTRHERVDWGSDYGRTNRRTLGDLRRLLRELADWPDDATIEASGVTAYRALPLHTGDEE